MIDDIINSVNHLVYQAISSLENGLTATPPARLGFKPSKAPSTPGEGDDENVEFTGAKQEIEEGLHQLETLLESTVDKNFDKFEIYVLRNILSVPEELAGWIRLTHYEVCVPLSSRSLFCCLGFLFTRFIVDHWRNRTFHIHHPKTPQPRNRSICYGARLRNHNVSRIICSRKQPATKPSLCSSRP